MLDFTFLDEEQVFGKQLEILEIYGTKCAITDFSILLGGYASNGSYTNEGKSLNNRAGSWWTSAMYGEKASIVNSIGNKDWNFVTWRTTGARPALSYLEIRDIAKNKVKVQDGILEVEYGEYPQTVASKKLQKKLEKAYSLNKPTISKTGKTYTTDSKDFGPFEARNHIEYEYKGKKYIRFVGDNNGIGEVLSNGVKVEEEIPYWVEVEPIKWLVDEKANIALSKKILFAGVQFKNATDKSYRGEFYETNIKEFMDKYFRKDIIPSIEKEVVTKIEDTEDKNEIETKSIQNKKYDYLNNEINDIINRILSIVENRIDKDEYVLKIDEIVESYNRELSMLRPTFGDNNIKLGANLNVATLYSKLYSKLNSMLLDLINLESDTQIINAIKEMSLNNDIDDLKNIRANGNQETLMLLGIQSFMEDIINFYNMNKDNLDSDGKLEFEMHTKNSLEKCKEIVTTKNANYETLCEVAQVYLDLTKYYEDLLSYISTINVINKM